MTLAVSGVGTIFNRWNGSKWERIAEVTAIKGPSMKRDTIDVTSMDSLSGYKEFIGGLREGGVLSLSMNFRRDTFDIMKADFESDVLQNYEIILPDTDATSFEFEGLVTELPVNATVKDAISMDCSIQISGMVVANDGAQSGSPS